MIDNKVKLSVAPLCHLHKIFYSLRVKSVAPEYKFTQDQIAFFKFGVEKYEEKHAAVEKYRTMYPDDANLFEACFGRQPKGNIEVIKNPMTLYFRCFDKDDYAFAATFREHQGDENKFSSEDAFRIRNSAGVALGSVKAKLGSPPNHAPIGYMNDKNTPRGNKKLLSDPERLPLVRRMWDQMLTGTFTVPQLLKEVNEVWGFRMPNGRKMGRSTMYYMFSNSIYYSMFEYPLGSGVWYRGTNEAIITEDEFDRVQVILGRKGRPRPKSHVFDFVGMMRCGECGASITAELKFKRPKNGKVHRYVYYHCTKRTKAECSQGSIEETKLKEQIVEEIDKLEIPPEFHSFAMKWFRAQNAKEAEERNALVKTQQKAYKTCLTKLDGLTDMRAAGEIGPEEYAEKKARLLAEKKQLDNSYDNTTERVERWTNTADEMFAFIEQAKWKLEKGNLQVRRSILAALGSNLIVKDKILSIDTEKCLFPVKKISKQVREIHKRFEPINTKEKQRQFEQTCSQSPTLLAVWDDVGTFLYPSSIV